MWHVSCVTCQVSCGTFFFLLFFFFFFRTKWLSLSEKGLLSTGPTPSSFCLSRLQVARFGSVKQANCQKLHVGIDDFFVLLNLASVLLVGLFRPFFMGKSSNKFLKINFF